MDPLDVGVFYFELLSIEICLYDAWKVVIFISYTFILVDLLARSSWSFLKNWAINLQLLE